ncbi:cytochrome P450 [Nocardia fusca]|uniref:cytochrome P450 n=1 Tax=Nocardia fusca TaxID=941183 RepID=UPI003798C8FC
MALLARPTIDFDHHSDYYRQNWQRMAADLHATGSPIAWSEHHGGFWVVGSWEGVRRIGADWESFTSYNDLEGQGNGGRGQMIPQNQYRLDLGESDPPLHTERRRLEAPFFTPKALRQWRPVLAEHLRQAVDAVIESGQCDLVDHIIIPTAARTALFVTGYGPDDWKDVAAVAHGFLLPPDHEDFPLEQLSRLRQQFRDMLTQRRAQPNGDLISALATGKVQGHELTLDEGESMMNALVFAGFDTAAATTVSALLLIDRHPEHRDRVVTDDAFRANLIEETLRLCPPPAGMARTAVRDVEFMGQKIAAGESVFMWLAAANRDPKQFENPDTFDPERANAKDHVSFSTGHHRCLGAPLAKVEVSEMVRVICGELADLRIDHDSLRQHPAQGGVNGFLNLRADFIPRGRRAVTSDEEVLR